MRNVRPNQLRKCIFLGIEELQSILSAVYENDICVDPTPDGLWYETKDGWELNIDDNAICEALSEYYDIDVLSIHIDDESYDFNGSSSCGVWISYKEER
jgi:hypothetical protein